MARTQSTALPVMHPCAFNFPPSLAPQNHPCLPSPPAGLPALPADVVIEGFEFSTWFGGSDQTWAPRTDQYTLFRNLRGFRNGPSTSDGSGDDPTRDFFAGGNGTDSQVVLREVIPISLEED